MVWVLSHKSLGEGTDLPHEGLVIDGVQPDIQAVRAVIKLGQAAVEMEIGKDYADERTFMMFFYGEAFPRLVTA